MRQSIRITLDDKTGMMRIECPYEMNMLVKAMPVRRWNKRKRAWIAPLIWRNIHYMSQMPVFQPDDEAAAAMAEVMKKRQETLPICPFPKDFNFVYEPFVFQQEINDKSYGRPFAIFADMGTGKSKMTIDRMSAYYLEGKIDQAIVVCLKSARHVWPTELKKHSPIPYSAHLLNTPFQYQKWMAEAKPEELKWLVMGVETFSQGKKWEYSIDYVRRGRTGFAIDEAHTISNSKTIRSGRIKDVSMACVYETRTVLTGTPITKGPDNFFGIFLVLDPDILGFPDYYSFAQRYVMMGGYEGREIIGYQNMDELFSLISPYAYQITKEEALPHLPEKLYEELQIPMTKKQKQFYDQMKKHEFYETDVGSMTSTVILTKMLRLQQIANGYTAVYPDGDITKDVILTPIEGGNPKIDAVLEIARETSGKVIIWCTYRRELRDIYDALEKEYGVGSCVRYHGLEKGYTEDDRAEEANKFQEDDRVKFFVATVQSGSLGLTLTKATTVVYFSNTFSIIDRKQSEDRAHREGQKNAVTYIDLQMEGSIDALVTRALREKRSIAEAVRQSLKQGGTL